MRGAEAVLRKTALIGRRCVTKERMPKDYRERELDRRLRTERTRSEARLLHRAKQAGVQCPTVMEVGEFSITMSLIEGRRPQMSQAECREAGKMLSKLHAMDVIHGDFTPANLIRSPSGRLFVIDFGLGFVSPDVEDKAVDVFTMLRALGGAKPGAKRAFLEGYGSYEKAAQILKRVETVEKRVRYAL